MCQFRQGSHAPRASLGFGKQMRTQGSEVDEAGLVHACAWLFVCWEGFSFLSSVFVGAGNWEWEGAVRRSARTSLFPSSWLLPLRGTHSLSSHTCPVSTRAEASLLCLHSLCRIGDLANFP